jgi:hypothetical protein
MAAGQGLFNPGPGTMQTMSYAFSTGSGSGPILPSSFTIDAGAAFKPMLKRLQLHRKMVPSVGPPEPYDFHEIISILLNYPAFLRKLGLVIDLEVLDSAEILGTFEVGLNVQGLQVASWQFHAAPLTQCKAAENAFFALPGTRIGITPGGMLAFEDENKYLPMQTDVIGGGNKLFQYATVLNPLKQSGATTAALPAERTVGLGMRMINRVAKQQMRFEVIRSLDNECFAYDLSGNITGIKGSPRLSADDLLRGLRVDAAVYDDATTSWKWYSLCRRAVQYFIGNETIDCTPATGDSPDAEGVVTSALVKQLSGEKGDEKVIYHLLESLFRWNGWSLCVPPPSEEEWPNDTCGPASAGPGSAGSQFGLNVRSRITVACGSLPLLRFGKKYKFRARVADIAGNGPPWNSTEAMHASKEIEFRRFEPVPTPVLRPDNVLLPDSPGESLETLVIRSNYNTPQEERPTKRFFYPPQTTLALAEYHGMFDVNGLFDPNKAKGIVKQYVEPLQDQNNFSSNYITDPLATGIVFYGLPGSNGSSFECHYSASGNQWPKNKHKLSIRIREGSTPPGRTGDEITVYLPKAEVVRVFYSSQMEPAGLNRMAQWARMQDYQQMHSNDEQVNNLILTAQSEAKQGLHTFFTPQRELVLVHAVKQPLEEPVLVPVFDPDNRKKDTMRRELHATWSFLDCVIQVHGKSTGSVDVYAYWTEFIDDPESDEAFKTSAIKQHVLNSDVPLNGSAATASSGGIVYYMEKPGTGGLFLGMHINDVVVGPMKKHTNTVKEHNGPSYQLAETYNLTEQWSTTRINQIAEEHNIDAAVVAGILKGPAPKHEFSDTKHRAIVYEVEGTTRFREYFGPIRQGSLAKELMAITSMHPESATVETQTQPAIQTPGAQSLSSSVQTPGAQDRHRTLPAFGLPAAARAEAAFRRTGPKTMTIHIPSSARPAPVRVSYAIPTFGWEPLSKQGNKLIRKRRGNGIRVFVERPWFSSGEDELLGVVVLRDNATMTEKGLKALRPYISQWGRDPIWKTANLPSNVPRTLHFKNSRETAPSLSLAEKESETQGDMEFSVVGYDTTYDQDRGLWYADIEMDPGNVYFPFVRLALARYQPYSVKNTHLSATTLTDFIQLLPDRTATVEFQKRAGAAVLEVTVYGIRGDAHNVVFDLDNVFEAGLEKARTNISDNLLKWEPLPGSLVKIKPKSDLPVTLSVPVPGDLNVGEYRLVIKEYETFKRMTAAEINALPPEKKNKLTEEDKTGRRLVYSDAFELKDLFS